MPLDPDEFVRNEFQQSIELEHPYRWEYSAADPVSVSWPIRVVAWNIEQGRHIEEQVGYLRSLDPDLVFLQEVDWNNARSGNRNVAEFLGAELSLNVCYGVEFIEIESENRTLTEGIGRGGGVTGNAILFRGAIQDCQVLRLPPGGLDWNSPSGASAQELLSYEPRIGGRVAVVAQIEIDGVVVPVSSAHLEDKLVGIRGRQEQFQALLDFSWMAAERPAIIGGDLNTLSHGFAILRYPEHHSDPVTQSKPLWEPEAVWWDKHILPLTGFVDPFDKAAATTFRRTIFYKAKLDWLLARGLQWKDSGLGPLGLSDHRPLWGDLDLRE